MKTTAKNGTSGLDGALAGFDQAVETKAQAERSAKQVIDWLSGFFTRPEFKRVWAEATSKLSSGANYVIDGPVRLNRNGFQYDNYGVLVGASSFVMTQQAKSLDLDQIKKQLEAFVIAVATAVETGRGIDWPQERPRRSRWSPDEYGKGNPGHM